MTRAYSNNNTTAEPTTAEEPANAQGEQSTSQNTQIPEQTLTALVVHSAEEKGSEEKLTKDKLPFKKLKFLLSLTCLNTSSSGFSLNSPPSIDYKGKGIVTEEDPMKQLMPFIEQGGSSLKIPNLQQFSLPGKKMTLEEAKAQMEEIKRLELLKAEKENSQKKLKALSNEELEAHAAQLATYEAKRAKILEEYNHCIIFRTGPFPITKISYRMIGFSKWVEVHALTSKAAKHGIPPPPQLTAFELLPAERKVDLKRKRMSELIHQVFVKENIVVDGM
ncbi:hypothetical protein Tco_0887953 [Tanacetum coccineum]